MGGFYAEGDIKIDLYICIQQCWFGKLIQDQLMYANLTHMITLPLLANPVLHKTDQQLTA